MAQRRKAHRLLYLLLALLLAGIAIEAKGADFDNELGRLFNTPQRRAQLDLIRTQPPPAHVSAPSIANVRIDGIVRRSNGGNTVWLNGEAHQAPESSVISIGTDSARLRSGNHRSVEVKVGETAAVPVE